LIFSHILCLNISHYPEIRTIFYHDKSLVDFSPLIEKLGKFKVSKFSGYSGESNIEFIFLIKLKMNVEKFLNETKKPRL